MNSSKKTRSVIVATLFIVVIANFAYRWRPPLPTQLYVFRHPYSSDWGWYKYSPLSVLKFSQVSDANEFAILMKANESIQLTSADGKWQLMEAGDNQSWNMSNEEKGLLMLEEPIVNLGKFTWSPENQYIAYVSGYNSNYSFIVRVVNLENNATMLETIGFDALWLTDAEILEIDALVSMESNSKGAGNSIELPVNVITTNTDRNLFVNAEPNRIAPYNCWSNALVPDESNEIQVKNIAHDSIDSLIANYPSTILDKTSADHFQANSRFVKRRVEEFYRVLTEMNGGKPVSELPTFAPPYLTEAITKENIVLGVSFKIEDKPIWINGVFFTYDFPYQDIPSPDIGGQMYVDYGKFRSAYLAKFQPIYQTTTNPRDRIVYVNEHCAAYLYSPPGIGVAIWMETPIHEFKQNRGAAFYDTISIDWPTPMHYLGYFEN